MARDPARQGCAVESLARAEPLLGTASRVRRWLLVEQPGPWGRDAVLESRLDSDVAATLLERARTAAVRVVLIRRPAWQAEQRRQVYLVRTDPAVSWVEELAVDDPSELPELDFACFDAATSPGVGAPGPATVHLVCTNGKHDPCCADQGRPVVRALQDAGVPDVWESSHIGGDRFAANIVALPVGVYYGRVTPGAAVRLLQELAAGRIDLDHYRGRCCHPPVAQAAEIVLRQARQQHGLHDVRVGPVTWLDDEIASVMVHDDVRGDTTEVRIRRRLGSGEHLTCAPGTSRPWTYAVVDGYPAVLG